MSETPPTGPPTGPPAGPSVRRVPDGDDRERLVCPDCGFISYENPKVVVGSVALWDGLILLCRRAIPPREGFWTLPAGYLETGETTEAGALREAWEEARARLEIETLLVHPATALGAGTVALQAGDQLLCEGTQDRRP